MTGCILSDVMWARCYYMTALNMLISLAQAPYLALLGDNDHVTLPLFCACSVLCSTDEDTLMT